MRHFYDENTLVEDTKIFKIGPWEVKSLPYEVPIIEAERKALEACAHSWITKFHPGHSNWTKEAFGVPSAFIRFDYVTDRDGHINVFEVEDRPAGLEINARNNMPVFDRFIGTLKAMAAHAGKPLGICISRGRLFNSDDFFWLERVQKDGSVRIVLGEVPHRYEDNLWFVRSLREEREYYPMSPHCMTTIEFEGDKSYGLPLGLWKYIDLESISWNFPFVAKPAAGCRCENVHMYHPEKPGGGYSTKKKITEAIEAGEVSYIQAYYEPEFPDFLPKGYAMIRRCYLAFDIESCSYKVVGGQWESRPKCHKIHGASDAVCGPLVLA